MPPHLRDGTRGRATLLWALLVAALALGGLSGVYEGLSPAVSRGTSLPDPSGATPLALPNPSTLPIKHFVLVMLENHAFDNYFGTYCPTTGPVCSTNVTGIPNGTCVPKSPTNASLGCIDPYPFSSADAVNTDPAHTWTSSHKAYDKGAMDGFYAAENQNLQAFGYYNQSTIPFYWDLAEEYGLGENWFSSALSYSLPEHWWMMASAAPRISETSGVSGKLGHLSSAQVQYLDAANRTSSIDDLLVNSTVSWKYYDFPLPSSYGAALDTSAGGECHGGDGAFNYWNPLAAKAETYGSGFASHFVNRSQIFGDLNGSSLPEVSWVIPDCAHSDHPPESPSGGQEWVASLVNALEASPEWNSTAMFITWDEYGGFYDHVAPRQINADGLGFRVPVIVVSPYARENFVSDKFEYFQSFLHLIEWRFGLNATTGLGAKAPLPLEYFNFKAPPRSPMNFTTWPNATYPIPLQAAPLPKFASAAAAAPVAGAPGGGGPAGSAHAAASPLTPASLGPAGSPAAVFVRPAVESSRPRPD